MEHKILSAAGSTVLEVHLTAGESVVAESGAMAWMDPGIQTSTNMRGGLGKSLKRSVLGGESLFQNTFTADQDASIAFTPGGPGDIRALEVPSDGLVMQRGAYLASSPGVTLDSKWAGLRGLLHEGLFALHAGGEGTLFFASYGALDEVEVDGEYLVDSGFAVAWDPSLEYRLTRARKIRSFLFGDQILVRYQGKGRLWVQNRSANSMADFLHPFRPVKSKND